MGQVLPFASPAGVADQSRDDELDDADLGALSAAGAEQVTMQIRAMVERAWDYIAIAYQGRAYLALGYRTWDEYVDDRLGDLRLTVPREERAEAVAAMSNARMSVRAIAKVLGVGVGTVHRGLADADRDTVAADTDEAPTIQGRDGKTYRRRTKNVSTPECSICGERHPESPDDCPWDLFAQGLGPRPGSGLPRVDDHVEPVAHPSDPESADPAKENPSVPEVVQAVTRAVCIVDELDVLGELADEIESIGSGSGSLAGEPALTDDVRGLIERIRLQIDAMAEVLHRLERLAGTARRPGR